MGKTKSVSCSSYQIYRYLFNCNLHDNSKGYLAAKTWTSVYCVQESGKVFICATFLTQKKVVFCFAPHQTLQVDAILTAKGFHQK